MKLDNILWFIQIISLVGFMLTVFFIVVDDEIFINVALAVLSLYIFIGVSYVNSSRNNGLNEHAVTKQVAGVVLGTVILIVLITALFKIIPKLMIMS